MIAVMSVRFGRGATNLTDRHRSDVYYANGVRADELRTCIRAHDIGVGAKCVDSD